jgi:CheY-like chemotaxis protein
MVYGFVKQRGGHIGVTSEPGHGTVFTMYFPRASEAARPVQEPGGPKALERGSGAILVVEDEEALRRFVARTLEEFGYNVLEASGPGKGIALAKRHRRIDLLITDVVMPRMNGPELAERVRAIRPGIRVLYIPGYTGGGLSHRGVGVVEKEARLLVKPFGAEALLQAVHAAFRGGHGPSQAGRRRLS